jgi:arsenate reductase
VSRRSPVWRERPLPTSKREAIDLMLEQPNLIKRPVLIKGSRIIFGFDKEQYEAALKIYTQAHLS